MPESDSQIPQCFVAWVLHLNFLKYVKFISWHPTAATEEQISGQCWVGVLSARQSLFFLSHALFILSHECAPNARTDWPYYFWSLNPICPSVNI